MHPDLAGSNGPAARVVEFACWRATLGSPFGPASEPLQLLVCVAGFTSRSRCQKKKKRYKFFEMWKPQTAAQVPTASAKRVHVAVAL